MNTKKIITISAISLFAVLIIAFGTIAILRAFGGTVQDNGGTTKTESQLKQTLSAEDTIKRISALFTGKEAYARKERAQNTIIEYKSADAPYTIAFAAPDYDQYERTDKSAPNDAALVDSALAQLKELGYLQTGIDSSLTNVIATTFDSLDAVCVAMKQEPIETTPASFGVACIPHSTITESSKQIKERFALAGPVAENISTVIPAQEVIEGNKTLQLYQVTRSEDKATQLIFAAIDGTWSYIGERPIPSIDDKDSYTVSSELTAQINDPKWGTFLKNTIGNAVTYKSTIN